MTLGLNALVVQQIGKGHFHFHTDRICQTALISQEEKPEKNSNGFKNKLDRVKKSLKIEWFSWHDKRLMFPISFLETFEV